MYRKYTPITSVNIKHNISFQFFLSYLSHFVFIYPLSLLFTYNHKSKLHHFAQQLSCYQLPLKDWNWRTFIWRHFYGIKERQTVNMSLTIDSTLARVFINKKASFYESPRILYDDIANAYFHVILFTNPNRSKFDTFYIPTVWGYKRRNKFTITMYIMRFNRILHNNKAKQWYKCFSF